METTHPRKLVIAGGSGFLGRGLIRHLDSRFDQIVVLTRGGESTTGKVQFVNWNSRTGGPWETKLDGALAIVNLVGRSVDCRKTVANKAEILRSRIDSVLALANAVRKCGSPPKVWVQSGTAHIYGDSGDEILDDSSPLGSGFAPDVGRAWEAAVAEHVPSFVRTTILRISFVLGKNGGALKTLSRLARFGLGGTVGNGRQFISWIHEEDLYRMIELAIFDEQIRGTYIATSPNPVTNRDFMRLLREAVHRPYSPPAPALLVRMGSFFLRTDPELALLGRRVVPTRMTAAGFTFSQPVLQNALRDLLPS